MASTCLTISDTIGSVEGSVAWLRDWSSSSFLVNMLSMLANIIAGRENCKEMSDNIFSFITKVLVRIRVFTFNYVGSHLRVQRTILLSFAWQQLLLFK